LVTYVDCHLFGQRSWTVLIHLWRNKPLTVVIVYTKATRSLSSSRPLDNELVCSGMRKYGTDKNSYQSQGILKMIYFSYVHSIISYGIFWGNAPYSINTFGIQKRIELLQIQNRDSCKKLFKNLNILPFIHSIYFPYLLFIIKNKDKYISNQ
jgi:hypothetical protein